MPFQQTADADRQKIAAMVRAHAQFVAQLYYRWLDEREYEDIADYQAAIQKAIGAEFPIARMTKRPFGFHFTIGTDAVYAVRVKNRAVAWGRVG